jgi:glycerol-3-phosphate acyltransferase PlsY
MFYFVAAAVVSYLLGSVPAGYLAGLIAGVDIRTLGSGNIGATNVTRVLGKAYGYPVFVIDFLKGFAAVEISILIGRLAQPSAAPIELFGIIGAVASVIGHSFPIWLKFKGGKGVATSAGALFGLMPLAALAGVVVWIAMFKLTRYVSVASITAAVAIPIVVVFLTSQNDSAGGALFYFSICLALLVIVRHRTNLTRLIRGTEPRFTRK